jgi:polyhydroxyalkanoate synthesis regulator phasin
VSVEEQIREMRQEIDEKQNAINYEDLDDETIANYESDIHALEEEIRELERESG